MVKIESQITLLALVVWGSLYVAMTLGFHDLAVARLCRVA